MLKHAVGTVMGGQTGSPGLHSLPFPAASEPFHQVRGSNSEYVAAKHERVGGVLLPLCLEEADFHRGTSVFVAETWDWSLA